MHEGFETIQLQPSISAENYVQAVYEGQPFVEEGQYFQDELLSGQLVEQEVHYVPHEALVNDGQAAYGPQYVYAMAPNGSHAPLEGTYDGRRLVPMQDEQGNVFLTEVSYAAQMAPPQEAAPRSAVHSNQSMGDVSVTVSSVPQRASVGSGQRQASGGDGLEDGLEAACDAAARVAVQDAPAPKAYRTASLKNMLGGLRRKSEGRDAPPDH